MGNDSPMGFNADTIRKTTDTIIITICNIKYVYIYIHMSGRKKYLPPAMDMAKVGGPLSVVKVRTSMLCAKKGIGKWVVPYRL